MTKEAELTKEYLENILESMEGGILTIDKNRRITSFNHSAEEITGFKREEVLNKDCRSILKSDNCERACPLEEVMETGKPIFNYEIAITTKTGDKVPVNITTSPLRSSDNKIIGAVENFRDLTKHKGLWGKLREERNKAQQYLNIAGVIIVAINKEGIITLINKRGCDVLGYTEDELIGKDWYNLCVPQKYREERKRDFEDLMAGYYKNVEDYENTILTKSGKEPIIAWHNTLIRDDDGHIIGTLSSGADITKRKQTEEELIRSEKMSSLGQLAASVVHEVNNPLAGIMIYVKLFLKKFDSGTLQSEGTDEQLLKMQKELERTTRIIRNLLDFARQSEPTMAPVEINRAVEAALLLVGNQISLENINLDKKLNPELPLVLADFDKIQQVLINIMLNATQAMPDGGTLTIATYVAEGVQIGDETKNTVRIDIRDTGVGIPKENLGKLFTPFFTTKEKGKGVGLGLSVVHGIIEKHDGKIDVTSKPDEGTTFSIYLEVWDEKEAENTHRRR
ncbi:MAG: PAS domain S-box protein [Candidatus Aminicenantes bacterium]|nr:PAS domain S-box protein [Candidatus Aminicenantes bacterium]